MEAANFPFHHSSDLFEQCLSFSNTATTTTTTATGCSGDEFNQPHDQALLNASIEDIVANKSCKRRRGKQKEIIDDQENSKKMRDSKLGEGQSGYIHVRARRGEATDSHSLAERVRRERINEKMKTLQAIVPGCDKQITGKALMLEEVINYVHSLQNEIQILSFKLASVNPMFGVASDASMITPDRNTTTYQDQLMLLQEDQMPCMISQNNEEIMWDIGEQRQDLDDLFAIFNNFNTF